MKNGRKRRGKRGRKSEGRKEGEEGREREPLCIFLLFLLHSKTVDEKK
jgi:hypothetical protein